jgi:hypothetical protein
MIFSLARAIKSGMLLMGCFFLSACHSGSLIVDYIRHPEQLKSELLRCETMSVDQARHDPSCMQAVYAYQQLMQLSQELIKNPELYGQKIMGAESRLAQLKAEQSQSLVKQHADLARQIAAQEMWINILQAVRLTVEQQ